jgi:hypothetical protein
MKSETHHPFVPMYYALILLKTLVLSLVPFATVDTKKKSGVSALLGACGGLVDHESRKRELKVSSSVSDPKNFILGFRSVSALLGACGGLVDHESRKRELRFHPRFPIRIRLTLKPNRRRNPASVFPNRAPGLVKHDEMKSKKLPLSSFVFVLKLTNNRKVHFWTSWNLMYWRRIQKFSFPHRFSDVRYGQLVRIEFHRFVYYESIKRELKIRPTYNCRCDERLKIKPEDSTRLTYTGFRR